MITISNNLRAELTTPAGTLVRSFSPPNGNAKALKSAGELDANGIKKRMLIHYMLPNTNICPMSTKGCLKGCLSRGGNLATTSAQLSLRTKTRAFMKLPVEYAGWLDQNLSVWNDAIHFRVDGTSDGRFERFPVRGFKSIYHANPNKTAEEYTKHQLSERAGLPSWMRITYSLNESAESPEYAEEYLANGHGVTMVVAGPINSRQPLKTARLIAKGLVKQGGIGRFSTVEGDAHDWRSSDPPSSIVVLHAKSKALYDVSGFVVRFDPVTLAPLNAQRYGNLLK